MKKPKRSTSAIYVERNTHPKNPTWVTIKVIANL